VTGEPAAVVERLVAASPEDVYDQWVDPAAMAQLMCPDSVRLTAITLDARVGGKLFLAMEENGYRFTVTGTYLELDRPRRLRFSWASTGWDPSDPESVVTVTFTPRGPARTLMTIHHAQVPPARLDRHQALWEAAAARLAARLAHDA
jgi:uncharacterized protein YndB with AHSA1/START domain